MPATEATVPKVPKGLSFSGWFSKDLVKLFGGGSNETVPPGQVTLNVPVSDVPQVRSDLPQPTAASPKSVRATIRPEARRYRVSAQTPPLSYDFERSRLDLVQLIALRRNGEEAAYDDRDILQRAILDHSGMARMFVHELVRRIVHEGDKPYDVVVSFGEYGAVFGSRLADALMEKYGQGSDVIQRFLEVFTPTPGDDSDALLPVSDYRLRTSRSDKGHLLSGKRIVFAVPTVTPESWPEVLRQAQFLRGPQTNSDSVRIVSIARLGRLSTDASHGIPHGLNLDAIVDFR